MLRTNIFHIIKEKSLQMLPIGANNIPRNMITGASNLRFNHIVLDECQKWDYRPNQRHASVGSLMGIKKQLSRLIKLIY